MPRLKALTPLARPLISSLRRNLQREHLERLIDLTLPEIAQGAAGRAISSLASDQLRQIQKEDRSRSGSCADRHDPYTNCPPRTGSRSYQKALDADYILTSRPQAGGGGRQIFIGTQPGQPVPPIQEQTYTVPAESKVSQPLRCSRRTAAEADGQ